jgi:hypothetical protein
MIEHGSDLRLAKHEDLAGHAADTTMGAWFLRPEDRETLTLRESTELNGDPR